MDNTKLTPELLAELRRLDAEATPGPWSWRRFVDGEVFLKSDSKKRGWLLVMDFVRKGMQSATVRFRDHNDIMCKSALSLPDARLIPAARNALPALLDEIERLRAALDALCWEVQK